VNRIGGYIARAAGAVALLSMPLLSGTADALPAGVGTCPSCIAYDFNYNAGSATNIAYLDMTDPSVIDQNFTSGAFAESGALNFADYYTASNPSTQGFLTGIVPHGDYLYLLYNLQGTLNTTTGAITFSPATASIGLYLSTTGSAVYDASTNTYVPSSGSNEIATFSLLSGGAASSGLGTASGSVTGEVLNTVQSSGLDDLFTTYPGGQDLYGALTLAFQYTTGHTTVGQFGTCSQLIDGVHGTCATADSETQLYISPVPEPTSLALLGSGLVTLAAWNRRSKKRRHESEAC